MTGRSSTRIALAALAGGLLRDLPLAHLVQRLAVDAERRGRTGLEALQADPRAREMFEAHGMGCVGCMGITTTCA